MKLKTLQPRLTTLSTSKAGRTPVGRPEKGQGLYTYEWKQARLRFLAAHPLCQCPDCDDGRKRITVATVVDHKIPHRGSESLFWDESNWQAMAKVCHDRKTAGGQ